jgi:hypothetical protein
MGTLFIHIYEPGIIARFVGILLFSLNNPANVI